MAFSRVKSSGWADNEVLTAAQINALDIDHSQAMDGGAGGTYQPNLTLNGEVFRSGDMSDFALMSTAGFGVVAGAWGPRYTASGTGSQPTIVIVGAASDQIQYSRDLRNWTNAVISGGLTVGFAAVATNGSGTWLAAPSGTTNKLYRSTDNGVNWSLTADLPGTPGSFRDIVYVQSLSRFIITGINSGIIITSDDGGASFTQRTSALAVALNKIGLGGSGRSFILPNAANTQIQRSDDGITWTAVTMPSSQTWLHLARNPRTGALIASTSAGTFFKSTDNGVNWTTLTGVGSLTCNRLVGFGPVILGVNPNANFAFTLNDGSTWEYAELESVGGSSVQQGVFVARNRIVICNASRVFAGRCIGAAEPLAV